MADGFHFLVRESRSGTGQWVELGKAYEGYEVREYDPKTQTLTLFSNGEETPLQLASLEANPTPMPVAGPARPAVQTRPGAVTPGAPVPAAAQPVRRPVRQVAGGLAAPGTTSGQPGAPPPPAWLQKLREEAAERRAQAEAALPVEEGEEGTATQPTEEQSQLLPMHQRLRQSVQRPAGP